MNGQNRRKLKRVWLTVGIVVLYTIAVGSIMIVSRRNAAYKTEELLEYACKDLSVTIGIMVDGMLAESADNVANDMGGRLQRLSSEACRELARRHGVDEVGIVDGKGVVVASSDPKTVGFDLGGDAASAELVACTNRSVHFVAQDFRENLTRAGVCRKYLSIPFCASEGFVLVGYDEARLAANFPKRYNQLMKTWQFGESGCYVCADAKTDRLLFDVYDGNDGAREVLGQRLQDVGFDPAGLKYDRKRTFRAELFGISCFCRNFEYLGYRILPTVPADEFYSMGFKITLSAAAILLVIFGIFCYAIGKIVVANRAIADMRAAEDERREKDMVMAKSIQLHVLPSHFPPYPALADNFDIFANMRTAKEVGGDFYDFYFVAHNRLAIVIADVSGKGVPAAMFMMRAKTALQSQLKGGSDIVEGVSKVNHRLCQGNENNMFVTAWIGIVDLSTGEVEYVNAGHNPPIMRHADGTLSYLTEKSGPPMAAMDGVGYRKKTLRLDKEDALFLYTDGITESTNRAMELYGEDRLIETLKGLSEEKKADTVSRRILSSVDAFAEGTEQADDITMLAFRFIKNVIVEGEQ